MPTQTFTAPGVLSIAHAGGPLAFRAAGGKGGIAVTVTPTGSVRKLTVLGDNGQRVVNREPVNVEAGTVEMHVQAHSGVSDKYPVEVTISAV